MPQKKINRHYEKVKFQYEKIFNDFARNYFPNINIRTNVKSFGSGDPYLIIDYKDVITLETWKNLIIKYRESLK